MRLRCCSRGWFRRGKCREGGRPSGGTRVSSSACAPRSQTRGGVCRRGGRVQSQGSTERERSAKDLHSRLQRFAEGAVAAAGPGLPVVRKCGVDLDHVERTIEGRAGVCNCWSARKRDVQEGGRLRGRALRAGRREPRGRAGAMPDSCENAMIACSSSSN